MPDSSTPFTVLLGSLPTTGRLALMLLLEQQPGIRVVSVGENPLELLAEIRRQQAGLLIVSERQLHTLEWLSGYTTLPVLLYCLVPPSAETMQEAKRWGVRDYISTSPQPLDWKQEVWLKVQKIMQSGIGQRHTPRRVPPVPGLPKGVVVIGGSTGSTTAIEQLVRTLPSTLASAVVIAVHLPASFLGSFVQRLTRVAALPVVAGLAGTALEPGRIIIAPGGRNMLVRPVLDSPWRSWQTDFSSEPSCSGNEPSIDILMHSVARTAGSQALGVVLTGLGCDGTRGAEAIRQHGGTVLVQDQASSAVFSMPNSVIQAGWANAVMPLSEISQAIMQHAKQVVADSNSRYSIPRPV